ncbi:MAG: hypothetical protein V3V12_06515 [Gammaproteobacteria bacterium]
MRPSHRPVDEMRSIKITRNYTMQETAEGQPFSEEGMNALLVLAKKGSTQ